MSDSDVVSPPGSAFLWRAGALASGAAGLFLLTTGGESLSIAVLLLVVALAAAGVLLGGGAHGPAVEGRLDLSARLGLGLLGGSLAAAVSAAALSVLAEIGLTGALGVGLTSAWSGPAFLAHLGSGAVWGMVLGILYGELPGASPGARGALFSLVPALYLLLKVYPVDRDLGLFGLELGALTFVFVLGLNFLWGMVAGSVIGWGEAGDETPVARPIDE
ncbi:hypothetical protein [Candidatus Palauibacter sp.]|uniref:hypothetical protein n=1 Tax=Candidatus Palauibacter sp. TaxID=3101350 RepID=UPI003C6EF03A